MVAEIILNNNFKNILFNENDELLPSVTELFELELAFLEYQVLNKKELLERGAYFESIDNKKTKHFLINTFKPSKKVLDRSVKTNNYFENGAFSTGYATHSLFPYRGKFHPQLIKGLLNIMGIKKKEIILDPMAGSGTTNIEASLMGINSIAVDVSPFCRLMIKTKYESLNFNKDTLRQLLNKEDDLFDYFKENEKFKTEVKNNLFNNDNEYFLSLLSFLDSMGYFNRTKNTPHKELFKRVLSRYIVTINNFLENPFYEHNNFGKTDIFKKSSAMKLEIEDNSIDGVITSPPYSFAIDYVKNDQDQLNYLGIDINKLKKQMIGLKGKNKNERLNNYFEDMKIVCSEISRVLKPQKFAIIIIGSNTNQTGGIRLEDKIISFCENVELRLVKSILKPIKGMRNTMKDEYILFLKKMG